MVSWDRYAQTTIQLKKQWKTIYITYQMSLSNYIVEITDAQTKSTLMQLFATIVENFQLDNVLKIFITFELYLISSNIL